MNGNPTVMDFGRLPWAIIIAANSSLELRDLIIHSYAPRSYASNTSHYYVGGLISWPSISMAPGGSLKRCVASGAPSCLACTWHRVTVHALALTYRPGEPSAEC